MQQGYIKSLFKIMVVVLILVLGFTIYSWMYPHKAYKFWSKFRPTTSNGIQTPNNPNFPSSDPKPTTFEEGKHYQKLPAKITTSPVIQQFIAEDPGKIQVIEFFSYACAWCQRLHPVIDQWVDTKPQNVVFYRFPVIFHPGWDKLAKAYYMVDQLGKTRDLDREFFLAIQQNNVNLSDEKLLKDFFVHHGISSEKYDELFNSFAVLRAYKKGTEINEAYQVTLSPILIINAPSGSYLLLASMAGSEKAVMDILQEIIKRESPSIAH